MRTSWSWAAALACAGVLSAQADGREVDDPSLRDERGTFTFVWENDWFGDSDQNYTNGFRVAWLSGAKPRRGVAGLHARALRADDRVVIRRGFALGHQVYTPDDWDVAAPLPDQHPYGAWLYGEYTSVVQRQDIVDQFSVQLGVVGPSAGGEWAQNSFHELIGEDDALGWDNQIGDEVGLVLSYDRKMRAVLELERSRFGVDVTPSFGATLGNIFTNAHAGLTLRLGQDLRNDYGPPRVRPSLAGAGYFTPADRFSWYLFAGVEGRGVVHDIFLDGSFLDEGDPSVDTKPWVADFQGGLVLQWGVQQLAITYVERSEEFDTQPTPQRFGAISWSRKF
jgi:hypothetical protein